MGADNFKGLLVGFLLFGLFAVLIVTAIYEIGTNYGVSDERMQEATGGALSMTDHEAELIETDTTAENYRKRFEEGKVDDVDDASGIFSVIGDSISIITTPFFLLGRIGQNLLGIPPVVTNTLLAILNLLLILAIWRVLRAGD